MYTAASEAGVPIEAVAALARHKSLNVAQKYARHADQLRRSPSVIQRWLSEWKTQARNIFGLKRLVV
jgi:hypothetical protein